MATLTLERVTKRFGTGDDAIVAVDDLDLTIDDGEFLVIVGPSGCGKSTTLRMVAGLEPISEGVIALDGEVINHLAPQERDIAMVFQNYALYPHMTVRGNMRFGLEESTDLPSDEIERRVVETAELLEIDELLDRKPRDLSGGQQQRVALGRAIVRDPAAFLMDEPLSNLDAKLRSEMRTELQRLQAELDVTTMYVTHDQTEAMTMGDRIAILNAGRLQQVATPLECYHRPANLFVAGFIGDPSMNFFDVERRGDRLVGEGLEYPLSASTLDDLGDRTALTLGIRPEDVELVDERGSAHDFPVTVEVVEPMGNENSLLLSLESGTTFEAIVGGMAVVDEGESRLAHVSESAIHVFDRETGEALHNRELERDAEVVTRSSE